MIIKVNEPKIGKNETIIFYKLKSHEEDEKSENRIKIMISIMNGCTFSLAIHAYFGAFPLYNFKLSYILKESIFFNSEKCIEKFGFLKFYFVFLK